MGDKVCGLCQHYHVWRYKDPLGNKWDACTREDKQEKVYSLQEACKNYIGPERIHVKESTQETNKEKEEAPKASKPKPQRRAKKGI